MEDHHFSLPSLQLQRLGDDPAHQMLANLRLELELTLEGQRTLISSYRSNGLDCEEPLFHDELEVIHLGSDLKLGEKKWETEQHPIEEQVLNGLGNKADEREESVDSLTKRAKGRRYSPSQRVQRRLPSREPRRCPPDEDPACQSATLQREV